MVKKMLQYSFNLKLFVVVCVCEFERYFDVRG